VTALTPTPVAIDETRQYRVKKGDSLSTIASRLYGRTDMADKIYQLNRDTIGANPSALKLNAILTLPESPTRVAGTSATN
jgi:nucleoid-associated protein YgaU